MDSLNTAFVQPFQGPQAAENALKLAAVLAPRINLGSRPLQQGEGEGLRNLFSAFGTLAEQSRRRGAEGQVFTGLQEALAGTRPFSSLPISDLPEATQRVILEEIGKGAFRNQPSVTDRIQALATLRGVAEAGGDVQGALQTIGLPQFATSGVIPPPPPGQTVPSAPSQGPITIAPEATLAPSLTRLPPTASASPFGVPKAEVQQQRARERLAALVSGSQGLLDRQAVLQVAAGLPRDEANFFINQLEIAGRLPSATAERTRRLGPIPPEVIRGGLVDTEVGPEGEKITIRAPKTPGEIEAEAISAQGLTPEQRLRALRSQTETPVTLANDLNNATKVVQAEQLRLFGGVNDKGQLVFGPKDIPVADMIGLIDRAANAQLIEEHLAAAQGRTPRNAFSGILPSDAELAQVEAGLSARLRRNATPQEVIREFAKILIGRRQRSSKP